MRSNHIVSVLLAYVFSILCGSLFNSYLYSRLEITYASFYATLITIITLIMYLATAMMVTVYNSYINKRSIHIIVVIISLLIVIFNLVFPFFNSECILNISVFILGSALVRLLISIIRSNKN